MGMLKMMDLDFEYYMCVCALKTKTDTHLTASFSGQPG